jgi:hypothetical protein
MEDAKHILNDEKINAALLENGVLKLADQDSLIVIHDGSDIRKKYSKDSESIGKVRDLDGHIINGYSSFNTVAVDLKGLEVTLLNDKIYSNRCEEFISQKDLKLVSKPLSKKATLIQKTHYKEIKEKVKKLQCINSAIIAKQQINKISTALKKDNSEKQLIHVIDRGADDNALFRFIDQDLQDEFVIRLKASRITTKNKGEKSKKLIDKAFPYKAIKDYKKLIIKGKVYLNACSILEWGESIEGYSVVRIKLQKQDGTPLFKLPMLLITNQKISDENQALNVYHIYLKRPKIEEVFKFLKKVLGWEGSQIRNYEGIKTILSFCYFIGGYFYEIESTLTQNKSIIFMAELGGGKGKVTRTYILRGFSRMIIKQEVDKVIEDLRITPKQMEEILKFINMGT